MSLEIVSVGSSSSGNSYIIIAGKHTLILDAGLPCKRIMAALGDLGIDPAEVNAVLVTHEHTDHVKSVRAVSRKCSNAVFYASRGTVKRTEAFSYLADDRIRFIRAGESFMQESYDNCNNITISAFSLSHDAAEPLGFTVKAGDRKLAVVTDTGIVGDEIYDAVKDSDMLVFESNHDEHMLMFGEYPYPLKMRIKGEHGHLSNAYAGETLARILKYRNSLTAGRPDAEPLRIMLAHLSFHNNMPLFARQTVEEALGAAGFAKNRDYVLGVAAKEGLSFMPTAGEDYLKQISGSKPAE